jgi:ELWxxDGT repeat protein
MAKDPGNTKGKATAATFNSSGIFTFRDSVSGTDRKDFFKFTLDQRSSFNGKLTRMQNNADLIVTGPSGTFASRKPGKQNENIDATLDPGQYFVQVNRRTGQTNYRLRLQTTAITDPGSVDPDPDPNPIPTDGNDTLTTASLRSIGSTQNTISDRVDNTDPNDYFKFTVSQTGRLVFNLGALSADANLALYRPNGNILTSSNGGSANESIVFDVTDASLFGTYSIRVFQAAAGSNTNYSLTSIIAGLPDNNDSSETAALITVGISPTPFNNRVDNFDPADFFKFNVTRKGQLSLALSGLSADANIALFGPAGSNLFVASSNGGTTTDQINLDINNVSQFGEYKLQVFQAASGSNTNYTMTTSLVPVDVVGGALTEVANALIDVDTATAAAPYTGVDTFVGGADAADVYYFTVAGGDRKFVSVNLTTGSGNPTVTLYQKTGGSPVQVLESKRPAVGDNEQIGGTLDAGTYFIQITDAAATAGVDYGLSVSARDSTGIPSISRDINFGPDSSNAKNLVNVGGNLYFFAESTELDPVTGNAQNVLALWKSDNTGTLTGTQQVKTFTGFAAGAYAVANNTLYFVANDGSGLDLWRTDGTGTGTTKVTSIRDGNDSITNLTAVGGVLYFIAPSVGGLSTDLKLWRSDGTAITTFQLDAGSTSIQNLTQVGNALYYSDRDASSPTKGQEVFRISNAGTLVTLGADDTATLANINSLKSSLTIDLFDINTRDPNSGGSISSNPDDFVAFGDSIYFTAVSDTAPDPVSGVVRTGNRQIWRIKNSASPGGAEEFFLGAGDPDPDITNVVRAGNDLYFWGLGTGADAANGLELYRLEDAANAATPPLLGAGVGPAVRVTDINTTGNSRPTAPQLVSIGNNVYFTATDGTATKLYQFNGTTVVEITKATGQPLASNISNLTVVGTQLFFTADDGTAATVGTELWQVDTAAFTYEVLDIFPGTTTDPGSSVTSANSSDPSELIDVGGKLFFTATDANNGTEVWSVG